MFFYWRWLRGLLVDFGFERLVLSRLISIFGDGWLGLSFGIMFCSLSLLLILFLVCMMMLSWFMSAIDGNPFGLFLLTLSYRCTCWMKESIESSSIFH